MFDINMMFCNSIKALSKKSVCSEYVQWQRILWLAYMIMFLVCLSLNMLITSISPTALDIYLEWNMKNIENIKDHLTLLSRQIF